MRTYISNAIIVGNTNALKGVEPESYNQIKEFFGIQTDAFLVSAAIDLEWKQQEANQQRISFRVSCVKQVLQKI